MELKEFLKKRAVDFLMIQAGITLSVGVIGSLSHSTTYITPYAFFMPFVYAFFCILPSFVVYSPTELSIRQMAVRKVIQFLLIELVTLLISYLIGTLHSTFVCIAIVLAVAVVYAAINLIDYLTLKSDTDSMTKKIQSIHQHNREDF